MDHLSSISDSKFPQLVIEAFLKVLTIDDISKIFAKFPVIV